MLRALRPSLTQPMLAALLRCLQHSASNALASDSPCAAGALDASLELLATLRGLVVALPPSRLVLFPNLVWLAVGLLGCNQVQLYSCGVQLLAACLGQLALEDPVVQNVLLAAVPAQDDAVLVPLLAALQPGGGRAAGGAMTGPAGEEGSGLAARQQKQGGDGEPDAAAGAAGDRMGHGRGVSTSSLSLQQGVGSSSSSLNSMAAPGEQQQARSSQQQLLLAQQRNCTWLAGLGLPLEAPPAPNSSTNSSISNTSLGGGAGPPLIAAQQLLLRGLLLPDTCLATLQLLTQLAGQLAANRHLLLPRLQRPGSPVMAAVMHHRRQLSAASASASPGMGHTVRTLSGWGTSSSPVIGWASPAATLGEGSGGQPLQPTPSPAGSLRGAAGGIERRTTRSPVVRSAAASRGHTGSRVLFRSTGEGSYPASRRSTATSTISERTGITRSTPNLGVLGQPDVTRRSSNTSSSVAAGAADKAGACTDDPAAAAETSSAVASSDAAAASSSGAAPGAPATAAAVAPAAAVGWSHRVSIDDTDEDYVDSSRTSSARTLQAASRRPLQQQQQQDASGTQQQDDVAAAEAGGGVASAGGSSSATGTLSRKKLPPAPFSAAAAATTAAAAGSSAPGASATPSRPLSAANSRRGGGLGWGDAPSNTLRDTLGTWRQRPGSRPVAQALFGEVSAQLVVTGVGLVPLLVAAVGRVPAQDPVIEALQVGGVEGGRGGLRDVGCGASQLGNQPHHMVIVLSIPPPTICNHPEARS